MHAPGASLIPVVTGPNGQTGPNGFNGPNGIAGPNGFNGPNGQTGLNAAQHNVAGNNLAADITLAEAVDTSRDVLARFMDNVTDQTTYKKIRAAFKALEVSEARGTHDLLGVYMLTIFKSRVTRVMTHHLFHVRSSMMADIVARSPNQMYTKAHELFTMHPFQFDDLGDIIKLVGRYERGLSGSSGGSSSSGGGIKLDALITKLRQYACNDLYSFARVASGALKSFATSAVNANTVEKLRAQFIRDFVRFCGSPNDAATDAVFHNVVFDRAAFDAKFEEMTTELRRVTGYAPVDPQNLPPDDGPKAAKNPIADRVGILPAEQVYLEELMNALVTKPVASLKSTLARMEFEMGTLYAADIRDMMLMTVTAIEVRVPLYFPLGDLRNAQSDGTLLMGGLAQGLHVGNMEQTLAGSFAAIAFSWSDFSISLIYVVKFVRFLAQMGALWMSVKIFSDAYVRSVYAGRTDPPPIKNLLYMFLGIDLTIQLFLVTVIVALAKPEGAFYTLINDAFMAQLLIDELATTAMVAFIGSILASFVWRKTYFHYKTDGLGAVKCYADMMVGVCAVMVIVPYFLLA